MSAFDAELAQRLSVFPITARGPMLGSVSGRHQSPHRGSSVEFAEYRRYQPGDDPRRLDWRAFGRSDRFYVKEFEADTNLRLVLVLDCSGSMGFGEKFRRAQTMASVLAYLAVEQGDAAGLVRAGEDCGDPIPPRRNAAQVSAVFEAIESLKPQGETRLAETLHETAESIRQRALVVILSDLFFETDSLHSALDHLRFRNHDSAVFQLVDREEIRPDWNRRIRIEDMEGGEPMLVEPDEIVDAYESEVRGFLDATAEVMRQTATDYHLAMSDQSVEETLAAFLSQRVSGTAR
ncbi:MAG: DUF58 domain-containing protein [Planctomycetota bacterium]